MSRHVSDPNQMPMVFGQTEATERMIEARVAIRAENEAIRWRLRLILTESCLMTALVVGGGLAVKLPIMVVLRSSALIGLACLATGFLLIGLSVVTNHLITRIRLKLTEWGARS
ncbi:MULTISPECIES: hypothetical protein [unclassified Novosphingobium]|uniref:hypothetical protein n=1 Tax=unclassified Novosphingobium TaxID=2644732 RepID=UPI000D3245EC|nr:MULTISPECIES: hypothetical protein [unclassified Novosphingobium]PTR12604.1 hypothetical protein C8K11_10257 [Novosphingobium sp. GV055]PUB06388.1 hypothetical protein C8K12_10257 [Novosphingobium sp. GV061]PUB22439.1 hypothetical protein C8K14_10257 [Novosphingobium sp. GV079]PUB44464.1 hypothetical protein C8K10_10257 [Novosphingobium sp. GV027]